MKFYGYKKCSTCRNAEAFLRERNISYDYKDITEEPPSKVELRMILDHSGLVVKKLFNTSGQVYRDMGLKDKMDAMTESQAIELLASNGKLIKRPLAFDGKKATVGFKDSEYKVAWR